MSDLIASFLMIAYVLCSVSQIDNFPPLEPQAQERESNPEPGFPQAAGPEDCETNRWHFSGIEPPRADVEEDDPPRKVD
ncbi:hypothetical protein DSO57_1012667 [Entomophthora muscae]|uniref:Uncharacterized protein n=1 Tax=Entomophthora muscae TaxID=34485 RepID=A0ACC2RWW9_9FUNG|nr:hypothetical protein DSO57_1012667 [Entomophthora muscae]